MFIAQEVPHLDTSLSPLLLLLLLILVGSGIWLARRKRGTKPEPNAGLPVSRNDARPAATAGMVRPTPPIDAKASTTGSEAAVHSPPPAAQVPVATQNVVSTLPANLTGAASKSIFISYRRQDSQHITGRIYDRLAMQFGRESIFKDVDSIPLGLDFREHLREQVGRCAVLVAVIGRNWNPAPAPGQQRMSDPRDHLRIE